MRQMIFSYVLDHVLGFLLGTAVLAVATTSPRHSRVGSMLRNCLHTYCQCATFLAFSIEIAAIVVLIREDFGINTIGMGDYTVRITHAVAMVALLPLVYPIIASIVGSHKSILQTALPTNHECCQCKGHSKDRNSVRFSLFVVCWTLALYPFFSKLNATFGESKIQKHQSSGNATLTMDQWNIIENICLGAIEPITTDEDNWMTAYVILAYLPLSEFVLGRVFWLGVEKNHYGSTIHRRLMLCSKKVPNVVVTIMPFITFSCIPAIVSGLLWSIIRTQQAQAALNESLGGIDWDNYWSFGQIVAVATFAPIFIECWNSVDALIRVSKVGAQTDRVQLLGSHERNRDVSDK